MAVDTEGACTAGLECMVAACMAQVRGCVGLGGGQQSAAAVLSHASTGAGKGSAGPQGRLAVLSQQRRFLPHAHLRANWIAGYGAGYGGGMYGPGHMGALHLLCSACLPAGLVRVLPCSACALLRTPLCPTPPPNNLGGHSTVMEPMVMK